MPLTKDLVFNDGIEWLTGSICSCRPLVPVLRFIGCPYEQGAGDGDDDDAEYGHRRNGLAQNQGGDDHAHGWVDGEQRADHARRRDASGQRIHRVGNRHAQHGRSGDDAPLDGSGVRGMADGYRQRGERGDRDRQGESVQPGARLADLVREQRVQTETEGRAQREQVARWVEVASRCERDQSHTRQRDHRAQSLAPVTRSGQGDHAWAEEFQGDGHAHRDAVDGRVQADVHRRHRQSVDHDAQPFAFRPARELRTDEHEHDDRGDEHTHRTDRNRPQRIEQRRRQGRRGLDTQRADHNHARCEQYFVSSI